MLGDINWCQKPNIDIRQKMCRLDCLICKWVTSAAITKVKGFETLFSKYEVRV